VTNYQLPITNLSLPLFVARVGLANDPQNTVAADDFALLTDAFDAGTYFHNRLRVPIC
jgi:hypothetical protein